MGPNAQRFVWVKNGDGNCKCASEFCSVKSDNYWHKLCATNTHMASPWLGSIVIVVIVLGWAPHPQLWPVPKNASSASQMHSDLSGYHAVTRTANAHRSLAQ